MASVTWGKCKSFLCLVLLSWYTLFGIKWFLLLTTNNSRENIYCDASGNIFNSTNNFLQDSLFYVLYCTVLYCTVLYCTVLYCTVLYCTVLYCILLYCILLYCTYCIVLKCIVLYCIVLYCIHYYGTSFSEEVKAHYLTVAT